MYPPTLHAHRSITKQQNEFVDYSTRPCVASFARTPIKIELTYVQGSVLDESQRLSTKLSKRSGPPIMAPVSSLGFGASLVNQFAKLSPQLTI